MYFLCYIFHRFIQKIERSNSGKTLLKSKCFASILIHLGKLRRRPKPERVTNVLKKNFQKKKRNTHQAEI